MVLVASKSVTATERATSGSSSEDTTHCGALAPFRPLERCRLLCWPLVGPGLEASPTRTPRTRIDGGSAWALTSMDHIAHIGRTACPTLQCCCTLCHQCRQPAHFRSVTCHKSGVHLRLFGMHPLPEFFVHARDEILSQETSFLQWTLLNLRLHHLGENVSFSLQLLNTLLQTNHL